MRSGREQEERRRGEEEEKEEEEEQATDIKSNNPHLAGGEKKSRPHEDEVRKISDMCSYWKSRDASTSKCLYGGFHK